MMSVSYDGEKKGNMKEKKEKSLIYLSIHYNCNLEEKNPLWPEQTRETTKHL